MDDRARRACFDLLRRLRDKPRASAKADQVYEGVLLIYDITADLLSVIPRVPQPPLREVLSFSELPTGRPKKMPACRRPVVGNDVPIRAQRGEQLCSRGDSTVQSNVVRERLPEVGEYRVVRRIG